MFVFASQIDFDRDIELGIRLTSDQQIGAADTDYDYIIAELEDAKRLGDRISINGDVNDAIFPGDRKRFRPSVLHDSLKGIDNVADATVDMTYKIYQPYAEFIDVIGVGNHDDTNVKYHHSDMVISLIKRLNTDLKHRKIKHQIAYGGYSGFITYAFYSKKQFVDSFIIQYHHGAGGTAPVTKGMIDFNRSDTWIEGADVTWKGHKHNKIYYKDLAMSVSLDGTQLIKRPRLHVMTGAYGKQYELQSQDDAMKNGRKGSYVEDGFMAPQGIGGYRIIYKYENGQRTIRLEDEQTNKINQRIDNIKTKSSSTTKMP